MVIYLSYKCDFVISTGVGIDDVVGWCFRKPVVYVNCCPIGRLSTFVPQALMLTKHHILEKEKREIKLSEIFSKGVGFCGDSVPILLSHTITV